MRSLPVKLCPGSDLRLSLEELISKEQTSGFVLGVVGNLSKAAFQCPGRPEPTVLTGNLEIITLNGTLAPEGVHLHLSLSDADCNVWGGHLEPGTTVLKGADVLVGLFEKEPLLVNSTISTTTPELSEPRIEIAVLPSCPWCNRALRLLRSVDASFNLLTIDNDQSFELLSKRSKMTTFPQVFIDGDFIGGYEQLAELHRTGKLTDFR